MINYHYGDVIMSVIASLITSLAIVYSSVYSGADQRKHQSSASLAFVRGIHRRPVNSPHKGPVTRTMFPFDDVIMIMVASLALENTSKVDFFQSPKNSTKHKHVLIAWDAQYVQKITMNKSITIYIMKHLFMVIFYVAVMVKTPNCLRLWAFKFSSYRSQFQNIQGRQVTQMASIMH